MSPFCESTKMAAPPLNKFPCCKTAPPLPETTAPLLTSLPSPFYKSHCSPRLWAAPSFPQPAWQFGPAIKPCSMEKKKKKKRMSGSRILTSKWDLCAWDLESHWIQILLPLADSDTGEVPSAPSVIESDHTVCLTVSLKDKHLKQCLELQELSRTSTDWELKKVFPASTSWQLV
jgi:hypothetical protein